MVKKPVKKKPVKKKPRKRPVKKKVVPKKPDPLLNEERYRSAGVQLAAIRHIADEVLDSIPTPIHSRAKSLEEALGKLKAWAEVAEDRLVNLGEKDYPSIKWPKVVAYWRGDVARQPVTEV